MIVIQNYNVSSFNLIEHDAAYYLPDPFYGSQHESCSIVRACSGYT